MSDTVKTYTRPSTCDKCHKPFQFVGDVPDGGWPVGQGPYCTCGWIRCKLCRQLVKEQDHE